MTVSLFALVAATLNKLWSGVGHGQFYFHERGCQLNPHFDYAVWPTGGIYFIVLVLVLFTLTSWRE